MRFKILIILLLSSIQVFAGGWNKKKGGFYFKVGERAIIAKNFYDFSGEAIPIRTLGNFTTSVYGEYGISDKWDAIAYLPFYVRNTLNSQVGGSSGRELVAGEINNGIGDFDLGVKRLLFQNNGHVMSASLILGLPTGESDHPQGLLTGDGEFNQFVNLEYGKGLGSKSFIGLSAGFNNRATGFTNEFRAGAEIGTFLFNSLWLIGKTSLLKSIENPNATGNPNAQGLFANNVNFLSVGAEASYKFYKNFSVVGGAFTALYGKNILAAAAFELGFSIDM
jgi:hypothetical protein